MIPVIGSEDFYAYLDRMAQPNDPTRHKFYDESVELMEQMGVHMTGDEPKELLRKKRPNESEEARKYRLETYKPKTKAAASKVTSVINRIYNERLYSVEFPESPSTKVDDDDLRNYLTEDMPYYTSLMNYIKSVFTKMHLKDPNGVIGVLPIDIDQDDTEFFEPIPTFYNSDLVYDFEDNNYFVINLKHDMSDKQMYKILIFTKSHIYVFARDKTAKDWIQKLGYEHGFDYCPAFRVGGVVINAEKPQLFESHIAGVTPHWDEAVSMFSDLSVAIINHLYPEKWEYTVDCNAEGCRSGYISIYDDVTKENHDVECRKCAGTGKITTKSPFDIYQINKDALNPDAPLQVPPFGYGEKELESTRLLEELAEKEIDKGYEAINMDILNRVGENQSGVAKVIDRQDLDGFLDVYSSHIFRYVLPEMILGIMFWRYWRVFNNSLETIEQYFPIIKEPTTFDVYSISLLSEEYANLKQSGITGTVLAGIQKDIVEKRFPDEETKKFLIAVMNVDPLGTLTDDQILASGRVIQREDLYIHTFAKDLVEEAVADSKDFLDKPLREKKEIIRKMAAARLAAVPQIEPEVNEPSE